MLQTGHRPRAILRNGTMNHSRIHANVKMTKRIDKIVWVAIIPISIDDELKFDYGIVPDYYPP